MLASVYSVSVFDPGRSKADRGPVHCSQEVNLIHTKCPHNPIHTMNKSYTKTTQGSVGNDPFPFNN